MNTRNFDQMEQQESVQKESVQQQDNANNQPVIRYGSVIMVKNNKYVPPQVSFFFSFSSNNSGVSYYMHDATTLERVNESEVLNVINEGGEYNLMSFGIPIIRSNLGFIFYDEIPGKKERLGLPWIVRNVKDNEFMVLFLNNDGKWTDAKGHPLPIKSSEIRREVLVMIPEYFRSTGEKQLTPHQRILALPSKGEYLTPVVVSYRGKNINASDNLTVLDKSVLVPSPILKEESKEPLISSNVSKGKVSQETLEDLIRMNFSIIYHSSQNDPKFINYEGTDLPFSRDIRSILDSLSDVKTNPETEAPYLEGKDVVVDALLQSLVCTTKNDSRLTVRAVILRKKDGTRCVTIAAKGPKGTFVIPPLRQ